MWLWTHTVVVEMNGGVEIVNRGRFSNEPKLMNLPFGKEKDRYKGLWFER
jgi:hypothetical protein